MHALSGQQTDTLLDLRSALFEDLKKDGLAHAGDELASRRVTRGGKPLSEKLSEDIWLLILSLKNLTRVPRSVLKNGK